MKCYLWLTSLSSNSYFSSHQSTSTFQKVKVTWPKSKKYLKVKVKWYSWFASLFPIKAKNELWNDLSTSMIRQWKWYYQKVKWYSWFGMFHLTHQPLIFRKWSLAFSKSFIGLTTRQGKLLLNKINQVKFTLSKLFDCRKWFKNLTKKPQVYRNSSSSCSSNIWILFVQEICASDKGCRQIPWLGESWSNGPE